MDYRKKFLRMAVISLAVIVVGAVVGGILGGFRLGPEYAAGTLVTIDVKGDYDLGAVEGAVRAAGVPDAAAVKAGSSDDALTLVELRVPGVRDEAARKALGETIQGAVAKLYPRAVTESVKPTERAANGLALGILVPVASLCAVAFLYGWARYGVFAGVSACVAALHDALLVLAVTMLLRIPVGAAYPAAVMVALVFSVYNSMVFFENMREMKAADKQAENNRERMAAECVRRNLPRTFIAPALVALVVLILALAGTFSLLMFAIPVFVGLCAGIYSSLFLTAPLWVTLETPSAKAKSAKKKPAAKRKKKK